MIGNEKYERYVTRYSTFLKTVRFEEYDVLVLLFRWTNPGLGNIGSDPITITSSATTKNSVW